MSLASRVEDVTDYLVGLVSPTTALQRKNARRAAKLSNKAYDSAQKGSRKNWLQTSGSADADLDADTLEQLRERSRDRYRNDSIGVAAITSLADNVVGSGLRPKLRLPFDLLGISRERAQVLERQADEVWRMWSPCADSRNMLHINDIQALAFSSTLVSGDNFVVPIMAEDPNCPLDLKLELVEGDRCYTPSGLHGKGRKVRNGIELGRRNQPIAYWIQKTHPGDDSHGITRPTKTVFRRLAARTEEGLPRVLHLLTQKRPGQSRGEPLFAPVLDLFKDADDYLEAEVIGAQVAACFAAFITKNDPYTSAIAAATKDTKGKENREEEIAPGSIYYLSPGETVTTANPGRPVPNFDSFVGTVTRRITSALGLPYEVATRDFKGTTYSQARAALLEARRMFQRRQQWLRNYLLQPVWQMLLEEAWTKGLFDATDFLGRKHLWTRTHWIAPGWGLIDPDKEMKAAKTGIAIGVTTRAKIAAAADGDDIEDITRQLAEEDRIREELGVGGSAIEEDEDDDDETQEEDREEEADDSEEGSDGGSEDE